MQKNQGHIFCPTCLTKISQFLTDMQKGNLIPQHFYREIQTFLRNQSFKDIFDEIAESFLLGDVEELSDQL